MFIDIEEIYMKGKKAIVVGLSLLLSLSISTVITSNDTLSIKYTFEPTKDGYGEFPIKDTMVMEIPGEPLTPYRVARILLPEGTKVKNVSVDLGEPVIEEEFDIPWGQPPSTFSDAPEQVERNERIYSSDSLYPAEVFQVTGMDYCKGFAILNIHLFPAQYMPKSRTVIFYPEMTVDVQFEETMKNELYRGFAADKADVEGLVDNPDVLTTYEVKDIPATLSIEEYIIITDDTMEQMFQILADHKANYVNGATVYTVSWITANYSGTDDPMKIRNFIIDKYTNNGTKYVLLGGDTSAVPYRGFYVAAGRHIDDDMLADMYFSHLDGTFNDDGDNRWAEPGEVDWYAEVAVGRAPCETADEAKAFVNKVITYELADKPERVLFHQARVRPGNYPDSRCLAYNCAGYMPRNYTFDFLFEENGTVTKSAWISHWSESPIAVTHIGHGNTNIYQINYEVGGKVSWYNTDVSSMTNTFWPWTTSVACITGQIEANDCLAEAYVMDAEHGAIAAIYNDNYGWFSSCNACKYSGEFCTNEIRACWSDGREKLGDMLNTARSYLVSSAHGNNYYRWCFYERNLVGDPESPCLTKRYYVKITYPSDGQSVSGTVTCKADSNCDSVKWYFDRTFQTETSAPFQYSWDTTSFSNGNHTIKAEAFTDGIYQAEDSVTCDVSNSCCNTVLLSLFILFGVVVNRKKRA
jgi:hypothetical protein